MNEFFNWHDFGYVLGHYWMWWLIAFALGIFIGWRTCETTASQQR